MKCLPGTRPQVAKLIRDIDKIDDSDILYKYVEEIASYYTSDSKTELRILMQYETDIKTLVYYYKMVNIWYVGYEPQTELEKVFNKPIMPDERFKIVVDNIRDALDFLIHYAASNKVFLPLDKLEELGLKEVKYPKPIRVPDLKEPSEEFKNKTIEEYWREFQRINKNTRIARVIESVYDSAISFYKAHGYMFESDLAEIPAKLRRIFKDDKQIYNDFCKECEGKDLVGIAEVYAKFVKSGRIERARSMKPIYNHFVSSDDSQYMTFTRYAK